MKISRAHWGNLPNGMPVELHSLSHANGARVSITNYGAALVSWFAPDRNGHLSDILLGHDTPTGYATGTAYMGAVVGRWANRIAGARFTLDGVEHTVDANQPPNMLHGGFTGFGHKLWRAEHEGDALVLSLVSPAGDAGFPGTLSVQITYTFSEDGVLTLDYEATTDAPTPLNLTNHAYFNLSGTNANIGDHEIQIAADGFFVVDKTQIPTALKHVDNTPFDFRTAAAVGARLCSDDEQIAIAGGIDHCYLLHTAAPVTELPETRRVAGLYHPSSGRELIVETTERGLQLYTGNELDGEIGKHGVPYKRHGAICLEAGGFPNQINMDDGETVVLRPGEQYRQITRYIARIRKA